MTLAQLTGFRFFKRSGRGFELRCSWLEITGGFGLALEVLNFGADEDWSLHIHLGWPNIYIRLPLPRSAPKDQMIDKWGFSLCTDSFSSVHFSWGDDTRIVHLPWEWTYYRHSILAVDGRSWISELDGVRPVRRDAAPVGYPACEDFYLFSRLPRWLKAIPYRCVLRSGEIQNVTATIGVDEYEHRRLWLRWLPLFARVRRSIDVRFSGEVGERAGSWKGGCIGCGYEMLADETPEECLYRMQEERKF